MEVSLQSFRKRYTYDSQKDLLGKGGFGEVYKAYDNEDKIFVALKTTQNIANSKYNLIDEIKRFKKLNHPNIINHIEAYEVNTGSSDIHNVPIVYHVGVLEFADKGTLADLLKEKNTNPRVLEDIAEDIINGLAYLHTQNIIHRDLKPSNILLFAEGEKIRAKISDFGIAKLADATAASTQLIGTVEYMAPEFFSTGNITTSADVWSLGVMLIEAFTGLHPFGKTSDGLSNEQIIGNILSKDLSHIPDGIHAPYKDIVTRCLLREISIRPSNANEIKGIISAPQDAFSEKTQVINYSKAKKDVQLSKFGRIKKWGASLLDFDISKPKRKKLIAREIVLYLSIFFGSIIVPIIIILTWNGVSDIRIKIKENRIHKIEPLIKSWNNLDEIIEKKYIEFAKAYFDWCIGSIDPKEPYDIKVHNIEMWPPNWDTRVVTTYGALHHLYKQRRRIRHEYSESENTMYNISDTYYLNENNRLDDLYLSYTKFANLMRKGILDNSLSIKLFNFIDYCNNEDLKILYGESVSSRVFEKIYSVNNLDVDGTDSIYPPIIIHDEGEFSPGMFIYRIKKNIDKPGWVEWFFRERISKLPKMKKYLIDKNSYDSNKFKQFFKKEMMLNAYVDSIEHLGINSSWEKRNLLYEIDGIKKWKNINVELNKFNWVFSENSHFNFSIFPFNKNCIFYKWFWFLFILFYPIRLFLLLILWTYKTIKS